MSAGNETAQPIDPDDNVLQALHDRARSHGSDPALLVRSGDSFEPLSASQMLADVRALAAGLIGAGVDAGDRVAIFSHARVEWTLIDYAIWQAGAVTVTIYETSSPDQVAWIMENSGATAAVVENDELQEIVEGVGGQLPALRHVFTIENGGLEELKARGHSIDDAELDARAATLRHDSPATLVYTSGTTGRPKGCVLTHLNLIWTIRQVESVAPELLGPDNRTLAFLPLAHILARVVQLTAITTGVPVGFGDGVPTLLEDLADLKPTWLVVVPRVLEKVHDGAAQKAGTGVKRRIFDTSARLAREVGAHRMAGTTPSWPLRVGHKVANAAVYDALRQAMGGELRWVISGGAPLQDELALFFRGVGIEVLEGYGLTETTGPATVHRPGHSKPGTVGPPMPGVGVRISDAGEIQLSGPLIFDAYWDNEAATTECFDGEWFSTGDLGELDDEGHLVITGRIKDLIVTAGGKNIAPAPLELGVAAHPLVSHAVVIGDNRPFIAALLTLDEQSLEAWADERGREIPTRGSLVEALADDPGLNRELQRAIDSVNEQVSRAEGIRSFVVLRRDFTVESGELTPTMKVRRSIVIEESSTVVETIYRRVD